MVVDRALREIILFWSRRGIFPQMCGYTVGTEHIGFTILLFCLTIVLFIVVFFLACTCLGWLLPHNIGKARNRPGAAIVWNLAYLSQK